MLGQIRPQNSAECLIRSGEVLRPRQISIDQTNDGVMKPERGALVKISDPLSVHSVHNTAGDTWRAPARRLIQKQMAASAENKRQKFSIRLRFVLVAKTSFFFLFQVWEKSVGRRGQPLAP